MARQLPHLALVIGVSAALLAPPARAAGFDPARGVVDTTDAAFAVSFESVASISTAGIVG
jgi:hypothetical protein